MGIDSYAKYSSVTDRSRTICSTQQMSNINRHVLCYLSRFHLWHSFYSWLSWDKSARQSTSMPVVQNETVVRRCRDGWNWRCCSVLSVSVGFSWTPRSSPRRALSLGGTERWLEVWNQSHSRAVWAFASWLITADSLLSSPLLLSLPSITPPPAEKVLLMTEEGYPIYLRAKPLRASSPRVPAERRLAREEKKQ